MHPTAGDRGAYQTGDWAPVRGQQSVVSARWRRRACAAPDFVLPAPLRLLSILLLVKPTSYDKQSKVQSSWAVKAWKGLCAEDGELDLQNAPQRSSAGDMKAFSFGGKKPTVKKALPVAAFSEDADDKKEKVANLLHCMHGVHHPCMKR